MAGFPCRYNGESKSDPVVVQLVAKGLMLPICPEHLAGLPTPRPSMEQTATGQVLDKDGNNYTELFQKGAIETLKLCRMYGCDTAVLKAYSPSCGCGQVYNGAFAGKLIDGLGVTANLLSKNGLKIMTLEDLHKMIDALPK